MQSVTLGRCARRWATGPGQANSEDQNHQTDHKTPFGAEASNFYGWPNINTAGIWLPTCAVPFV